MTETPPIFPARPRSNQAVLKTAAPVGIVSRPADSLVGGGVGPCTDVTVMEETAVADILLHWGRRNQAKSPALTLAACADLKQNVH